MSDVAQSEARARILAAAARLVAAAGIEGASIREVCAAAGVTPPTIYHHFGDKGGLLDAVVAEGFQRYLAEKRQRQPSTDPVEDLRRGWAGHVEFGVRNPVLYGLMYGGGRPEQHPAALEGEQILRGILRRIAEAGLLRLPVEEALQTVHAGTVGTTILLVTTPDAPGIAGLSERVRDCVLGAVLVEHGGAPVTDLQDQAAKMLAALASRAGADGLTLGERTLLLELLARLAG